MLLLADMASDCAAADQVQTCRHLDLRGATEDMVTCCEEVLRSAQAHEDIHLQAVASHVLGLIKIDSPVRGDKTRCVVLIIVFVASSTREMKDNSGHQAQ